jgi:SAM-dependent methyltransferase
MVRHDNDARRALPDQPGRSCWCGARDSQPFWSGRYWKGRIAHATLDRCNACGTIRSGALRGITMPSGDGPGGNFVNLEPSGWERLNAPIIVAHHRPGPLLEVGANTGMLLSLLRASGLGDLRGLEPNPACAAAARQRGERVDVGWFDSSFTPDTPQANIVMSHVLEHIDEPLAALELAANSLLDGGRLFVFVPNIESLRAQRNIANWGPLNPVDHKWHFAANTLGALVARHGGFAVRDTLTTGLGPPRWSSLKRIYRSVESWWATRTQRGEQLVFILERR